MLIALSIATLTSLCVWSVKINNQKTEKSYNINEKDHYVFEMGEFVFELPREFISFTSGFEDQFGIVSLDITKEEMLKNSGPEIRDKIKKFQASRIFVEIYHLPGDSQFRRALENSGVSTEYFFAMSGFRPISCKNPKGCFVFTSKFAGNSFVECGHPTWTCVVMTNPFRQIVITRSVSRRWMQEQLEMDDGMFWKFFTQYVSLK